MAVDIVQQQVKMDEFIYGITLRKANARSNACFCLTHAAFQELVAAAPSLDAKINHLHEETQRAIAQAKTSDYYTLMNPVTISAVHTRDEVHSIPKE